MNPEMPRNVRDVILRGTDKERHEMARRGGRASARKRQEEVTAARAATEEHAVEAQRLAREHAENEPFDLTDEGDVIPTKRSE